MDAARFWPGANPDEDVPTVHMSDLKALQSLYKELNPEKRAGFGVGIELVRAACSAGADIGAVTYRYSMLGMLKVLPGNLLAPWEGDEELRDAVLKVAATIQMKWMEVGVPQTGLPFDVEAFLQELRKASPQ